MIYFIVTTSIYNDCPIRKQQYINGITRLKNQIKHFENYKLIIIENNGKRDLFLNDLDVEIFFTENNFIPTHLYGNKELQDILDCIKYYNIQDNDLIVKMTGRYIIDDNCNFLIKLQNLKIDDVDCILRYGSYQSPVTRRVKDCITGLIGLKCSLVKQIKMGGLNEWIEHNWAAVTFLVDLQRICILDNLGINICPGGNTYSHV